MEEFLWRAGLVGLVLYLISKGNAISDFWKENKYGIFNGIFWLTLFYTFFNLLFGRIGIYLK